MPAREPCVPTEAIAVYHGPANWRANVMTALLMLIAIAVVARMVWELIAPLIPALVALTIIISLIWLFFRPK